MKITPRKTHKVADATGNSGKYWFSMCMDCTWSYYGSYPMLVQRLAHDHRLLIDSTDEDYDVHESDWVVADYEANFVCICKSCGISILPVRQKDGSLKMRDQCLLCVFDNAY